MSSVIVTVAYTRTFFPRLAVCSGVWSWLVEWCFTCTQTVGLFGTGAQDAHLRVQELRESRGGRPGLSVLTSLTVSVDVTQY